MRILLATLFFPPQYNAGTENYTLALARSLMARGHTVEVICASEWGMGDSDWNGVTRDIYKDVPVHRIKLNWTKASNPNQVLYYNSATEKWFGRFIDNFKPDIVHVTSAITLGIGIFRSVQRAGIPLILTLTDFWFICPTLQLLRSDGSLCDGRTSAWECQSCMGANSRLFNGVNSLIPQGMQPEFWARVSKNPSLAKVRGIRGIVLNMTERKQKLDQALSIPDRVFAPSEFVQQKYIQLTSVPVEVLRHGHDLTWIKKLGPKTPSNKVRFAFIGQIQPTKGVHILIDAFQKAQIYDQATLSIFGDTSRNPDYFHELNLRKAEESSIMFCGRFGRDQLADVFANIDVVVVPSIWYENAPLSIQEAFASRTPVIASNLGGMAEAVNHEVDGLLFEFGDVEDLVRQLQRIVHEPSLLECLQDGIPEVKTIQQEIDEVEIIYSDLINNHNGRRVV